MKPVNEYRKARHFNLTGTDVRHLAELVKWLDARGQSLIAVVPTEGKEDLGSYTCRVGDNRTNGGVYDYEVESSVGGFTLTNVLTVLESKVEAAR